MSKMRENVCVYTATQQFNIVNWKRTDYSIRMTAL